MLNLKIGKFDPDTLYTYSEMLKKLSQMIKNKISLQQLSISIHAVIYF